MVPASPASAPAIAKENRVSLLAENPAKLPARGLSPITLISNPFKVLERTIASTIAMTIVIGADKLMAPPNTSGSVAASEKILDSGKLDDEGLRHLAKHPRLVTLGISNCDLDSVTPRILSQLPHLKNVYFSNLNSSDLDLTGFSQSSSLQRVALYRVDLSPAGYAEIARLPQLQVLELYGPDITVEKLDRLVQARKPFHFQYEQYSMSEEGLDRLLHQYFQLEGMQNSSAVIDQARLYSIDFNRVAPSSLTGTNLVTGMTIKNYSPLEPEVLEEELAVLIQGDHIRSLETVELQVTSRLVDTLIRLDKLQQLSFGYYLLPDLAVQRLETEESSPGRGKWKPVPENLKITPTWTREAFTGTEPKEGGAWLYID